MIKNDTRFGNKPPPLLPYREEDIIVDDLDFNQECVFEGKKWRINMTAAGCLVIDAMGDGPTE